MPKVPYKSTETPEYLEWKAEQNIIDEKKKKDKADKKELKKHLMDPAEVQDFKQQIDAKYGKHPHGGYSMSDRICRCGYYNIKDINFYIRHFNQQHHKDWMNRPKPVKEVVYGFDD